MSELLFCPFCGGEAEPFNPFENIDGLWCVICSDCACSTGFYQTEAEAVAAWNTRAERTCRMETAEGCQNWNSCSECDADYYTDQPINYCPNCGARVMKSDQDLLQEVGE